MRHFRSLLLPALLCLLAVPAARGQRYFFLPDTLSPKPLGIIKLAPLSLLDPYNTFQAGFEYIPRRGLWTLQAEGGYGNHHTNAYRTQGGFGMTNRPVQENWRLRSEMRLYTEGYATRYLGFYVAAEVLYKRSNWRREESVGRECEDGVCAFFERIPFNVYKDVLGFHGKAGFQVAIVERLLFDVYGGLGTRYVWVHSRQLGPNDSLGRDWVVFNIDPGRPGRYRLVSGALGFKLGYLLYRKE